MMFFHTLGPLRYGELMTPRPRSFLSHGGVRTLGVATVVSVMVLSGARSALGQSKGTQKTSEEYALEARELAERNDYRSARALLMEVWRLKQSYDIAGNLGVTELRLGRMREAAEHLTYCEQNFPAVRDAEQTEKLETVRGLLKEAREQVGVARIRVTRDDGGSAEGAGVFVDGRPVGKVAAGGGVEQPLLSSPEVFVDAGSRRFSASLAGCKEAVAVMAVTKGGAVDAGLVLSCRKEISLPLVIAGASVAAAGIGVGIGTWVHSSARRGDAQSVFDELKKGGLDACLDAANQVRCNELTASYDDSQLFKGLAVGGFVVGGVATAATLIYVLAGRSPGPKPESRVQTALVVGPGGGSAVVRGSF